MPSAHPEQIQKQHELSGLHDDSRNPLIRSTSDQTGAHTQQANGAAVGIKKTLSTRSPTQRSGLPYEHGAKSPISPTMSLRDVQNESSTFPLTNIEDPSDIAQELSNLQALRRMSMDVGNTSDPDLLPFNSMSLSAMPSIAPSRGDDEGDPSRLLWVPAAVHPELAPTEFKNFLESRVQTIKRRSGDSGGLLSPDGLERSDSGGLRRKKSMLSRQIDNSGGRAADNYVDGSERLDSKRTSEQSTELSLDELVKDPTSAVKKLAQEAQQPGAGPEGSPDDMPILPMAPAGMGLRRSTRTTYRKGGSLRSGERLSFNKRTSGRKSQQGEEGQADAVADLDAPKGHVLARVQSEPISENFSRPNRSVRRQQKFSDQDAYSSLTGGEDMSQDDSVLASRAAQEQQLPIRTTSATLESRSSVPQILETPAPEDEDESNEPSRPFPKRSSSQQDLAAQQPTVEEPPSRSPQRPPLARSPQTSPSPPATYQHQAQQAQQPQQSRQQQQSHTNNSYHDPAFHPSALPGGGATRTDSLTYIPTLPPEERKNEKKSKKDDDSASVSSSKSGGWSKWLNRGSDEKKEKKKEEDKKKSKSFVEKAHDNVRLDVLQSSIESAVTKGRESLLLDRDNVDARLTEERRKESSRKSDTPKKEKEGGLFSGLFGGGKKKADRDSRSSKGHHLRVSEETVYKPLKPDVDYPWTRFPLLEERAIYRMAHLKLANPRRSLASQVLLSNFMYNYLAIVQAMHPQVQVPQSPQQRRLEEERRRKEQEEYLAQQQQMQQAQEEADQEAADQYNFEYHRVS